MSASPIKVFFQISTGMDKIGFLCGNESAVVRVSRPRRGVVESVIVVEYQAAPQPARLARLTLFGTWMDVQQGESVPRGGQMCFL